MIDNRSKNFASYIRFKVILPFLLLTLCSCLFFSVRAFSSLENHSLQSKKEQSLTFDERVAYQRAIEEVYWRHRIWPKENPTRKPSLDEVMPLPAIREKVDDYLRKSSALDSYWNRPITSEQLQAEVNRLIKQSRKPEILSELLSVLHNDQYLVAECLARPLLSDRLLKNWYGFDERIHVTIKEKALAELLSAAEKKTELKYSEKVYLKASVQNPSDFQNERVAKLNPDEWQNEIARLNRIYTANPNSSAIDKSIISKWSDLQEDENQFYAIKVIDANQHQIKVAISSWVKQPFESWWQTTRKKIKAVESKSDFEFHLPNLPMTACTDGNWSPISSGPPSSRSSHFGLWTGTEMIIWGSATDRTGGKYDPATDTWSAMSIVNAPATAFGQTAVWTGTEMIVWGGTVGGQNLNTGARYNPATDTWVSITTANAPTGRYQHTAVWCGNEMVIWGGQTNLGLTPTGGRYNPSTDTWTATSTTNAPSGRNNHSVIWTGTEMIVWGGNTGVSLNTGGRYNLSTNIWIATSTANNPRARQGHTATWTGSEMIVCGGAGGGIITADRYNPFTDTWIIGDFGNPINDRNSHTAIWTGTEIIIWGGTNTTIGAKYNPLTNLWSQISNTPNSVSTFGHSAVWTGSEMIIWNGGVGARYNPISNTWVSVNATPLHRRSHTTIWTGSEMIIWGGITVNSSYLNSGGRYDPVMNYWSPTSQVSVGSRSGHTAVWTGTEMIIWGGTFDGTTYLNTGSKYNVQTDSWTNVSTVNAPTARINHSAVWSGSRMIIWGGQNSNGLLNTGGSYNPTTNTWTGLSTVNAPSLRINQSSIWTGSEMIIWGGISSSSVRLNTGGRYNPNSDNWVQTSANNAPAGRELHTAIWTGTDMIIWGGFDGVGHLNSGAKYNPTSDTWTALPSTNAPIGRSYHTAVWTGSEMIVWGGTNGTPQLTGGRYNKNSDSWMLLNQTGAPSPRFFHTAIWDGSSMIVLGGFDGTNYYNTGARYCANINCAYSISPDNTSFTSNGGNGNFTLTTTNGCGWAVTSNANWITVTSSPNGTGSTTISYTVAANAAYANRSGTISVADQTFTVNQSGIPCVYTIEPMNRSHTSDAGSDVINVSTPAPCSWTAVSNDSWIMITAGQSGQGNGVVQYSFQANPSENVRSGSITLAGQTFTINQAGIPCVCSIAPTNASFPSAGGQSSIAATVTTGCSWTAVSNDSWITITAGGSGTGNGTSQYTVAANSTTTSRSGTITIAGHIFTVNQDAAPTAIGLTSITATAYDGGILLEWQTGFEVDNLGFNIYREENGKRTLVNRQIVAGLALKAGSSLSSGEAYSWWDATPSKTATYWLEDLDLKGRSTMHGPFYVKAVGGAPPARSQAAVLSKLGSNDLQNGSHPLESLMADDRRTVQDTIQQASLAGQRAVKILVKHEGWYRVSQKDLVAAGLPKDADPRNLQLYVGGREVPITVSTGSNNNFDEASFIEFYGLGIDTPSTDTNTYWLITGKPPGKCITQVKGEGVSTSATSFTQTVERKDRSIYFAALLNGDKENFFGPVISSNSVEQTLELRHIAPNALQQAVVDVTLQGVTITP